jgi:hypothetical protein
MYACHTSTRALLARGEIEWSWSEQVVLTIAASLRSADISIFISRMNRVMAISSSDQWLLGGDRLSGCQDSVYRVSMLVVHLVEKWRIKLACTIVKLDRHG